jgi:SET and MYND domain-containing protein
MEARLAAAAPVRVETRAGRGRCVVAARDIAAGELIFTSAPLAAFPASDARCMECWRTAGDGGAALLRCPPCKTAFCGPACQRAGWALHKVECPLLRGFKTRDSKVPPALWVPLLLAARMYRAGAAEGGGGGGGGGAAPGAPLRATLADAATLRAAEGVPDPGGVRAARVRTVVALGRELGLLPPAPALPDARVLADVAAFEANNFSLTDETLDVAGFGVYPLGALLNHACAPNAVLAYGFAAGGGAPPTAQFVRALLPIAAGEEVTHSYVDATKPAAERAAELRATYGFECGCAACAAEAAEAAGAAAGGGAFGDAAAADAAAAGAGGDAPAALARARAMLAQSRTLASEPALPLTVETLAAMEREGAAPPAAPVPPAVAAAWRTDATFPAHVLRLEVAVTVHALRLLARARAPRFGADVMRGVLAALAAALAHNDFAVAEAASRHLLASLRARPTLRASGGAAAAAALASARMLSAAGAPEAAPPVAPLYALQLVPVGDIYLAWARAAEVAAAAATPGAGQAAAAAGAGRAAQEALPRVPLAPRALAERAALDGAFYAPPGPGGAGEPLAPGAAALTTADLRAAAAALYRTAARGIALAFGRDAPYAARALHLAEVCERG